MSVHFIAAYDIHDHETFAKYTPGGQDVIMKTLERHGGKLVCVGVNPEWLVDQKRDVVVCLEFPTREAAMAWHEDPDYVPVRQFRLDSTKNILATIIEPMAAPE